MTKSSKLNSQRTVKLQIFSRDFPFGNSRGNATYVLDFMRYLQLANCEIDYVVIDPFFNGKTPWCIISSSVAAIANVSARGNLKLGRILLKFSSLSEWLTALMQLAYNLFLPNNLKNIYRSTRDEHQKRHGQIFTSWDNLATTEEVAFVNAQLARFKPDIAIVNYAFLGNILECLSLDESVLRVMLTHDIRHQRVADFNKIGVSSLESNWTWEAEALQLRKAQILLAIQNEDARALKEMAPQSEVICMPISAVCHSHIAKQVRGRCLFVGSYASQNIHGLQWFLEYVWPLILESLPYCSLHVCGSVGDKIYQKFANVRLLGRVDNLKAEYSSAEVCLVPLLAGSGLKIKLVEALSYGRACVSTSIGIQGLSEITGSAALVADTAEDFVTSVSTLLTNPEKRQWMQEQAYRYVTEKFSPKVVYQPFIDRIYEHLQRASSK